jgi:hypothetical protein
MNVFSKFEHQAASVLKTVVMDAKRLVEVAAADIADLENKLVMARRKAADLAAQAYTVAQEAAIKAKTIAEQLANEAEAAKAKADALAAQIPGAPILMPAVVAATAASTQTVEQPIENSIPTLTTTVAELLAAPPATKQ